MRSSFLMLTGLLSAIGCSGRPATTFPEETNAHTFTAMTNGGEEQTLASSKGKVLLFVNTASRCGLTGQYTGLQNLQERFGDQGFSVMAFPSNDFMGQEPGTDAEIAEFCSANYDVTFPLYAKTPVTGSNAHPLFDWLSSKSQSPSWNFTKYLVGKDGNFIARFGPRTGPESSDVVAAIETASRAPDLFLFLC